MPPIKIACSGYTVRQATYQARLNAVELVQMFDGAPRSSTVERWKQEAKSGFEFIACAPEAITHPKKSADPRSHRYGYFQDTSEVHAAYRSAASTAQALGARTMFFHLARTASPSPDHLDRMFRFFKKIERGGLHFIWQAPASWPASLVASVSSALRIHPATNPLAAAPAKSTLRYFRLGAHGKSYGIHQFSDEELVKVKNACASGPSYVVFNNGPYAYQDAIRFASLIY